ncbi:PAS domain S-box-containing protein [Blastococcus saxobsidens]|uniref:PAS domain S-box-containing protein n=1 Tax=Blastococcus saxobsidens TaxID=138336 RepID=A0A4Q7Y5C7_9ACTN|nr:PAS domain S-box-containing protein [Blastococcus saxobsidens]
MGGDGRRKIAGSDPADSGRAGGQSVPDARGELLDLARAAAGVGTFDWDLTTGVLSWDERLLELFGLDEATFDRTIEGFNARLHPDDLDRVTGLLQKAIDTCGDYEAEYRIQRPDGSLRWVAARGRALCDGSGVTERVLGAAWDVTDSREAQYRVVGVLEDMAVGFIAMDHDWVITLLNAEGERIASRARADLVGANFWEAFPATVGSEFETSYRRAVATGETVAFDAFYPEPLNIWVEVRAVPSGGGLHLYFLDVTERVQLQQRNELLAEVTRELTGTLDAEEAVARLADLVVPALADWCLVSLVQDDQHTNFRRSLRDVGFRHSDPERQSLVAEYAQTRIPALLDGSFVERALSSGQPIVLQRQAAERIRALFPAGRAQELIGELAPEAFAVLPLRGRGRTAGLLSLFRGAGRGGISADDVATAAEIAGRAGLALDNARLYREQRGLAEGLQRSLLTPPPEPDHAQVVVRYVPAAQAAQVGGDWYDAFLQPGGATVLVIGDVVGHDTQAAAAMGQVRTIVRTLGAEDGHGPAEILSRADTVMRTLMVHTVATVAVVRLEQTPSERARGVTRLRWSNAGHPPPFVINPDGSVYPLTGLRPDLLLGVRPDTRRREHEVVLDRGSIVVLYTDGLVERRDQDLDAGLQRLQDTLDELAGRELDELCDELLSRLLPDNADDDVALVAVELHPQNRLRPPQAGPNVVPPNVPDSPPVTPQPD